MFTIPKWLVYGIVLPTLQLYHLISTTNQTVYLLINQLGKRTGHHIVVSHWHVDHEIYRNCFVESDFKIISLNHWLYRTIIPTINHWTNYYYGYSIILWVWHDTTAVRIIPCPWRMPPRQSPGETYWNALHFGGHFLLVRRSSVVKIIKRNLPTEKLDYCVWKWCIPTKRPFYWGKLWLTRTLFSDKPKEQKMKALVFTEYPGVQLLDQFGAGYGCQGLK